MLLWLAFSVVAAAVVAAIVRPLVAGSRETLDPAAADIAVFKDQLAEIAADRERGLIGAAEAEAAHAEVARRLLSRQRGPKQMGPATATGPAAKVAIPLSPRLVTALVALAVPLGAMALYLKIGSPSLPARPYEARLKAPADTASLDELVAKVEARLREKPDDGQGWDVVAPVYMVLERYQDASKAYAQAISLLGESPKRLAGLAEAQVLAANGMVNEMARLAYERLRVIEPSRLEPRFWLALAKEQDGKLDLAAADYRALLAEAPPDAPWRPMVEARLNEVLGLTGGTAPTAAPSDGAAAGPAISRVSPGPAAADVEAAAKMTPAERSTMIERMVDGLASRLKANGKDLSGWVNLVRAYSVLGRRGDAVAALTEARGNLAGDSAALAELDALAKTLGLGS